MSREIHVFGDWEQLGVPRRMGMLRAIPARGSETFSFEYDGDWLRSENLMLLDPDLVFHPGPQYAPGERPNFGLFLDSSPDRWGRVLMQRKEAVDARISGRPVRALSESDYLLGVHDEQRMGGLRFKQSLDGPFLAAGEEMAIPPWSRLRELEHAAWSIQNDDEDDDTAVRRWLRMLIAPGSSLGGARPKAGVCDEQGQLWIAKFPGRSDDWDVGAWEMVAHRLAHESGVNVAEGRTERFANRHTTFLTKRFDRRHADDGRRRLQFASAMTMLGYMDGADHAQGASYLEIVDFLTRYGSNTTADLEELWRRIVFSICIRNTDDHLRNHGFLLESGGWRLSPAYDLNPSPHGQGLSLAISDVDNSLSLNLAMEVREFFRLSKTGAGDIIQRVFDSVGDWRQQADRLGISRDERERMSPAFAIVDEQPL